MSRAKLTKSIIRKWRHQKTFIRFLNGDIHDCRVCNLQYVSLRDALNHIHDWAVDWDMDLTEEERLLVLDENWRRGLSF